MGLCALFVGERLHDDAGGVSFGKRLNPEPLPVAPPSVNNLLIAPDEQVSPCVNADLCCKALYKHSPVAVFSSLIHNRAAQTFDLGGSGLKLPPGVSGWYYCRRCCRRDDQTVSVGPQSGNDLQHKTKCEFILSLIF